jgi:hypothetical protein
MKSASRLGLKVFLLTACIWFQITVFALSLADPIPFVYSSYGGKFMARVEPGEAKKGKTATAQVFKYNESTKQYEKNVLFLLENKILPEDLLITEDGTPFVGVGDWWNFEYENPVIIVYDGAGKVLKRFRIEDFLSKQEVAEVKVKSGGMPGRWSEGVALESGSLNLRVIRDSVLKGPEKKHDNFLIDLKTLKIRKWEP